MTAAGSVVGNTWEWESRILEVLQFVLEFHQTWKSSQTKPRLQASSVLPALFSSMQNIWNVGVAFLNGFLNLIQFLECSDAPGLGVYVDAVCAMRRWMVSSWFPSFTVFIPAFPWAPIQPWVFHTLTPVPTWITSWVSVAQQEVTSWFQHFPWEERRKLILTQSSRAGSLSQTPPAFPGTQVYQGNSWFAAEWAKSRDKPAVCW